MSQHPAIITALSFAEEDRFSVYLLDGREISVLVDYFPAIKNVPFHHRQDWQLLDEQVFSFANCDEIFHLREILGVAYGEFIPALEYAQSAASHGHLMVQWKQLGIIVSFFIPFVVI
jgi:hypothetical protein